MDDDHAQWAKVTQLQHREIDRLEALTDRVESLSELVRELMAWLQEPQSTDLADAIKALVSAVGSMEQRLTGLPAAVADELDRRRKTA